MSDNGKKLIAAVRAAAERNPYQVIGQCVYIERGEPCCLIGQGLWDAGLIKADTFQQSPAWQYHNSENIKSLNEVLDLGVTSAELTWLLTVQRIQDHDHTWHQAILWADNPQDCPDDSLIAISV